MMTLFFTSVGFCLYSYLLFPLILHILVCWKASHVQSSATNAGHGFELQGSSNEASVSTTGQVANALVPTETVSIVIALHNEMQHLPAKLASLEALTYPKHLLEFIFVSDGSSDETVPLLTEACAGKNNWHIDQYPDAAGKPTALNLGVSHASGDIVVFMDARQRVSANAVDAMVKRLNEPGVGAVSGELMLTDEQGVEVGNVGLYWKYEKWIRENESKLFSTTGATGALYAIRRCDYPLLAKDALLDDFEIPVSLLRQGKRTVFETTACAYDRPEEKVSGEFRRKARTLAGNFQSFKRNLWMFNPKKNPVWWQFISHKVCRLLVPYALVLAMVSCVYGRHEFLTVMLTAQVLFYSVGLMGMLGLNNRITSFVSLFMQLNAAAVVGACRALRGGSAIRWKTT